MQIRTQDLSDEPHAILDSSDQASYFCETTVFNRLLLLVYCQFITFHKLKTWGGKLKKNGF